MELQSKPLHRQPHRIIDVALDSHSLVTSSAELEIERHKAVSDLLYENSFALQTVQTAKGPYRLILSLQEERLLLHVHCNSTGHREELIVPLAPLRQHMQDYTVLCENFYKTARAGHIHRLEALDAGRRSIHDESAEILTEALDNKAALDKSTARRLFSLIYVLHMRSHPWV